MSIASEITRINNNISAAYTAVSNKGGTLPLTQNSANLATAIGTISGGGSSGLEYEQGTFTINSNGSRPTISFSNTHTKVPIYVAICDVTNTTVSTTKACIEWVYFGNYDLFEVTMTGPTPSKVYYGATYGRYYNGGSNYPTPSFFFEYPSSDTTDTSNAYIRYHVTESYFIPGVISSVITSFIKNRTYKWIAIWA